MDTKKQELVLEAFSRQAWSFDSYEESNKILKHLRSQIRHEALEYFPRKGKILELNAGTGLDALYFAQQGYNVHATEVAPGMLQELNKKAAENETPGEISVQKCSYLELEPVHKGPFDGIFSNFGGLNCTSCPDQVFKHFSGLLKPGGHAVLIMMPPVCPWELSYLFRGKPGLAFRRLQGKKASTHLEGINFTTWYFSPSQVKKAFPEGFRKISLKGLASLLPPPYMENFPERFPGLFGFLQKADRLLRGYFPFNRWADHFILVMRREF